MHILLGVSMARSKTDSHNKVLEAAKAEFLEYGFVDASMRRIAQGAGLTASGLYKHFPSKEEMFAALVEPLICGFDEVYLKRRDLDIEKIDKAELNIIVRQGGETVRIMNFIYDHFDEFRLLVCKSQSTKFENFVHEIATREESMTNSYMSRIKKRGIPIKSYRKNEFHLLVTSNVDAILQAVRHGYSRREALHYARTLDDFYRHAWLDFFGL